MSRPDTGTTSRSHTEVASPPHRTDETTDDVLIIGGSFAGLAAALQLGRARRRVRVLDTGLPRNRFAHAAHGLLGHDGRTPAAILADARAQLAPYASVSLEQQAARRAEQVEGGFRVTLANGRSATARRLILAYGVRDDLAAAEASVAGFAARWGTSVLHCPYCHGYEVRDQRLGVLAVGAFSLHPALLLPDWSRDLTLLTNDVLTLSDDDRARLTARGVTVEHGRVVALHGDAPVLSSVEFADGRHLALDAIFSATPTLPTCDLHTQLGCATDDGPLGPYLRIDPMWTTSVPGVLAAGDLVRPFANLPLAIADGTMAGSLAHASLVMEESGASH